MRVERQQHKSVLIEQQSERLAYRFTCSNRGKERKSPLIFLYNREAGSVDSSQVAVKVNPVPFLFVSQCSV